MASNPQKQSPLGQLTTWYDPQVAPAEHIKPGTEDAALDVEANVDVGNAVERSGAKLGVASVCCELMSMTLEDEVD